MWCLSIDKWMIWMCIYNVVCYMNKWAIMLRKNRVIFLLSIWSKCDYFSRWQWSCYEWIIMWFVHLHAWTDYFVLNKYCTYNKPIPKILHVKTLQNLCKMRCKSGADTGFFSEGAWRSAENQGHRSIELEMFQQYMD